jgi:hypothetical protein
MGSEESLMVVCLTAAVCLGLMLWLYFSGVSGDSEPVVLLSGDAGAPCRSGLYQVQVKEWEGGEYVFKGVFKGTCELCQAMKKDLLKRGYSVTDVRVVQLIGERVHEHSNSSPCSGT